TAMQLTADIASIEALLELRIELDLAQEHQRSGSGEVVVRLALAAGGHAQVRLGGGFGLNGELAERLAAVGGISKVALVPLKGKARLRLVA
ncbi:MAG: hypothetical protein KJ872_09390, partial [Alphaproteobacteria bacterium]|nr:hypothetical protein [Alphaproteobacteria bacterium]